MIAWSASGFASAVGREKACAGLVRACMRPSTGGLEIVSEMRPVVIDWMEKGNWMRTLNVLNDLAVAGGGRHGDRGCRAHQQLVCERATFAPQLVYVDVDNMVWQYSSANSNTAVYILELPLSFSAGKVCLSGFRFLSLATTCARATTTSWSLAEKNSYQCLRGGEGERGGERKKQSAGV